MFSYRVKDLDKLMERFNPAVVAKANVAGANKATQKARTFISKSIRARYTVAAKAVSKRVALRRASRSNPVAELRYRGPRVGLINFRARSKQISIARKPRGNQKGRPWGNKRQAVTVQVRKDGGRKRVESKSGFIATGANGNEHIFYRVGKERNKLRSLKSLSIPEMVLSAEGAGAQENYQQFIEREYDIEFDRALRHYLRKSK